MFTQSHAMFQTENVDHPYFDAINSIFAKQMLKVKTRFNFQNAFDLELTV